MQKQSYTLFSFCKRWLVAGAFLSAPFFAAAQCTTVLDNFETQRKITYARIDGVLTQNASNPVNGLSTCAKYVRDANFPYANLLGNVTLGNGGLYREGRLVFKLDVYSTAPGTPINITIGNKKKSEQDYPSGRHSLYHAATTTANQWETLVFVYQSSPDPSVPNDSINQINIQFAPGSLSGSTFYFDNVLSTVSATVHAGTDQTICKTIGKVPLDGRAYKTGFAHWNTNGTGIFNPHAKALNATYQPSLADLQKGSVILTLHGGTNDFPCDNLVDSLHVSFTTCTGLTVQVPKLSYCAKDTFVVKYSDPSTTYTSGNTFIVQLSSPTGSFASFTNLGSLSSTASAGEITCIIPPSPAVGTAYRIRVLATGNPTKVGIDNGADIRLNAMAYPNFTINKLMSGAYAKTGEPLYLDNTTASTASCQWKVGDGQLLGASTCSDQAVNFAKEGKKTISLIATDLNGCSATGTNTADIYSCEPIIPANAYLVDPGSAAQFPGGVAVWVKPGASYTPTVGGSQTIYVSAGGSVSLSAASGASHTVYLEAYASFTGTTGGSFNTVIYDAKAGVSNTKAIRLVPCAALQLHTELVTAMPEEVRHPEIIQLYPNPSVTGQFTIQSMEPILDVTVRNVLGQQERFGALTNIQTTLKGMLLVEISTTNQRVVRKVQVQE